MAAWKTFPEDIPVDQSVVWVRVKYYYSQPFLAVWDLASQTFTSSTGSIDFPVWAIARWKSQ